MSRTFLPRLVVAVFLVVLVTSGAMTVRAVLAARERGAPVTGSAPTPATPAEAHSPSPSVAEAALVADRRATRAAAVLRSWDVRRARAWESGDAARLTKLYSVGSDAGRHDVAMLTAYRDRGLSVVGMRTQLLVVEVLERSAGRWRLRVTDRLAGGEVVGPDGVRHRLPRDRASTRVVVLDRSGAEWLVAEVSEVSEVSDEPEVSDAPGAQPSAAASTPERSRSANR